MVQQLILYHEEGHIVTQNVSSEIEIIAKILEFNADMYAIERLGITTIDKAMELIKDLFKNDFDLKGIRDYVDVIYRLTELGKITMGRRTAPDMEKRQCSCEKKSKYMAKRAVNGGKKGSYIKPDQIVTVNSTLKYAVYNLSNHYSEKKGLEAKYNNLKEKMELDFVKACRQQTPEELKELGLDPKSPPNFVILNILYNNLSPMLQQFIFYHGEGHIITQNVTSEIKIIEKALDFEADMYAIEKLGINTTDKAIELIKASFKEGFNLESIHEIVDVIYRLTELGKITR
jgi:hypothetical protein